MRSCTLRSGGETETRRRLLDLEDVEVCCRELRAAICLMSFENDTHEYTQTANPIIPCTPACIQRELTHLPTHGPTHPPKSSAVVFCCLYLLGWVCSQSSREENGRRGAAVVVRGGGGSRSGGGCICWRWRVDSICIWHTDCTKYANRQTMTFAVLFSL